MKCFVHSQSDALGLCKFCQKGLCIDCLTDLGHGLACKGLHENNVQAVNAMTERTLKIYAEAPKNVYIGPIFFAFMGLVFVIAGWSRHPTSWMPMFMGVGFLVFAIVVYRVNKKAYAKADS